MPFRSLLHSLLAAIALALPATIHAQPLAPGERIRLRTLTERQMVTGVIAATSEDSLVIVGGRHEHRVALHRVRTLERYQGQSRTGGLVRGILNGGLGATLLALGYHAISSAPRESSSPPQRASIVLFAGVGAAVGGVVGAWIGTERWERLR